MDTNRETALFAVLFLFFFQLLTEFVAAVYAIGLLGVNIPVETVSILLFLAPFLMTFLPKPLTGKPLSFPAALALLAGLLSMFAGTRERMLLSGLGTASFLAYFPAYLRDASRSEERPNPVRITAGLTAGVSMFILFRALNSGIYPYGETWFRIVSAGLAAAGIFLLLTGSSRSVVNSGATAGLETGDPEAGAGAADTLPPGREIRTGGTGLPWAVLGFFAAIVLLYFAFASPYVIARWTGTHKLFTLALTAASLGLFSLAFVSGRVGNFLMKRQVIAALNILFLLSIAGTLLPNRIVFPVDPSAYPVYEPSPGSLAAISSVIMLLLFPVIFLDVFLFIGSIIAAKPTFRKKAVAFGLGSLFLLLAVFAQVLTTVYDYMPVIGPLFRDRFAAVLLAVGCCMALPAALAKRMPSVGTSTSWLLPTVVISAGLAAVAGAVIPAWGAVPHVSTPEGLRVLTWNIQQGYSSDGQRSHDEQIEVLRASGAGLIGLQETDSARISGGNADLAGYYAERLGMRAYHGPGVVPGTFGIALLSRYEIEDPETFFMYSTGEQTAAIHAQIRVGEKLYNVFVTHLGNDGDMAQQQAVLKVAAGLENVIIMGDFNFTPDTAQYAVTTGSYEDAWLKRPSGTGRAETERPKRIDHVFVSRNLEVLSAEYLDSPASDHPSLTVEVR